MNGVLVVILALITLLGTFATAFSRDPFDKVIGLGLIAAGVIPFIVDRGYLDVAGATALITPIGTIFILHLMRRKAS
ncbi:MAG: EhaD family protein [Methanomicrobiales archaeon]|nr:EhaD family protein [Methanomicrobiales archaeon]